MTEGGEPASDDEDVEAGDDTGASAGSNAETPACDEADCERAAAVRLHVPWADDRLVCTAHARVLARPDGVVAEPIEGAEWS